MQIWKNFLFSDLPFINYGPIKVLIRSKLYISLNIAPRAKWTAISTSDPCNYIIWHNIDKNRSVTYFQVKNWTLTYFFQIWRQCHGMPRCQRILVSDLRFINYGLIKVLIRPKLYILLNIARRAKRSSISTSNPCNDMIWHNIDKNGPVTYFWVIFAKYRAMHDLSSVCLCVCARSCRYSYGSILLKICLHVPLGLT